MQGQLFTQDFLEQGITETEQWRSLDGSAFGEFVERLQKAYKSFAGIKDPNEATTERQLIDPILKALGWDHFLPQQSAAKHRSDVPDYLLFEDEAALARVSAPRNRIATSPEPPSSKPRNGSVISIAGASPTCSTTACPRRKCCDTCRASRSPPSARSNGGY